MNAALDLAADPVIAAALDMRTAAHERSGVTARIRHDATTVRDRLEALSNRLRLRRSVMVVDDNTAALYALVTLLSADRYPVIAVTHDRTAAAALASVAAEVLVVHNYGEAPGLCRLHRCAVLVIDEHLRERDGTTHSGATLAATLPRGPRVFVVTSETDARDSLADAARITQVERAVVRTDSGRWMDDLRAQVHAAVDEAAG